MSAQIAQLFIAVDRRSDGSHRVSLVYNVASNPNPNPSSLLPQSLLPCLSPLVPLLSSRYWIRLTHPPPSDPPPLLPLYPADPPVSSTSPPRWKTVSSTRSAAAVALAYSAAWGRGGGWRRRVTVGVLGVGPGVGAR
jgi:hypothetical protein